MTYRIENLVTEARVLSANSLGLIVSTASGLGFIPSRELSIPPERYHETVGKSLLTFDTLVYSHGYRVYSQVLMEAYLSEFERQLA